MGLPGPNVVQSECGNLDSCFRLHTAVCRLKGLIAKSFVLQTLGGFVALRSIGLHTNLLKLIGPDGLGSEGGFGSLPDF